MPELRGSSGIDSGAQRHREARHLRRRLCRLGQAAAVTGLAVLLAGCGGPAVTSSRLQDAVGVSFSRLYVLQQNELGHDVTPPDATSTCVRNGSAALTGAGSWTCAVHFPYPDGHVEPLSFDVEVQPVGCYTAAGPPAAVGGQKIRTATGVTVTNPLFVFDGCFDTR